MSANDRCGPPGPACDLGALDPTQRNRRAELAQRLRSGVVKVTELPDGYAFHLGAGSLAAESVDELVALERLCCPFLDFGVRRGAGQAGTILEVTGGAGAKELIAAELGAAERR